MDTHTLSHTHTHTHARTHAQIRTWTHTYAHIESQTYDSCSIEVTKNCLIASRKWIRLNDSKQLPMCAEWFFLLHKMWIPFPTCSIKTVSLISISCDNTKFFSSCIERIVPFHWIWKKVLRFYWFCLKKNSSNSLSKMLRGSFKEPSTPKASGLAHLMTALHQNAAAVVNSKTQLNGPDQVSYLS